MWNSTARKYERVSYKPQSRQKKSPTTAKPQKKKKFDQNRKPHAKQSKPINVHIPVLKTLIDPIRCWPTLVTRYCSGTVSRNRIIHRIRTWSSMLDTLEIAQLQPHGILIWIIDLHFMAKWRSPSFKYRRGFDLLANVLKIQQRTPGRCSYFQFVSSRLAIYSKP